MSFYVYRFMNVSDDVIYIGKTSDLYNRMKTHFSNYGHLSRFCYYETTRVECVGFDSRTEMEIYEIYFINKFLPKYNTNSKYEENFSLVLPEVKWETHLLFNKDISKLKEMDERKKIALEHAKSLEKDSSSKGKRKRSDRKMRVRLYIPTNQKNKLSEKAIEKGITMTSYISDLVKEVSNFPHINDIEPEKISTKEDFVHIKLSIEEHILLKHYAQKYGITHEQAAYSWYKYSLLPSEKKNKDADLFLLCGN